MTLSKQRRHTNSRGSPCLFETELTVVMILLHIHKVTTWYTLNLPSVVVNYNSIKPENKREKEERKKERKGEREGMQEGGRRKT